MSYNGEFAAILVVCIFFIGNAKNYHYVAKSGYLRNKLRFYGKEFFCLTCETGQILTKTILHHKWVLISNLIISGVLMHFKSNWKKLLFWSKKRLSQKEHGKDSFFCKHVKLVKSSQKLFWTSKLGRLDSSVILMFLSFSLKSPKNTVI